MDAQNLSHELAALEVAEAQLARRLTRAMESQLSLYDDVVDPRERFMGEDGELWSPLSGGGRHDAQPYRSDGELDQIRQATRWLSVSNEFAINGHENRVSYIVGWGHTYKAVAKKNYDLAEDRLQAAQEVLDEFLRLNRWGRRQQEIIHRRDRDGECFLRFFAGGEGILRVRFVEPEHVRTPQMRSERAPFGIETDPEDVETIVAFHLQRPGGTTSEPVPGEQMQHRKLCADSSTPRGLPLFYPVRKNLSRAAKILRNMSAVAEIHAAIALIRKHAQGIKSTVTAFAQAQANVVQTSSAPGFGNAEGNTKNYRRYDPGTIIDAPAGVEYEFPASKADPGKYVAALQAELRAIASRLVMPEFMLTSDASNANFSSTMVAEGPAVKMFERLQWDMIEDDLAIMRMAIRVAVETKRLREDDAEAIEIVASPPTVQVRDQLKEAQVRQIDMGLGILSPQTACAETGREYDQEQANIDSHNERSGTPLSADRPALFDPGQDEPDEAA